MNRRVVAFLGLLSLVLVLLVPAAVSAQTVTPPPTTPTAPAATPTPVPSQTGANLSLAEVRAMFDAWTQVDVVNNGYVRTQGCYDKQGYFAWKTSLVDGTIDLSAPEGLILDPTTRAVNGVVYVTTGTPPTAQLFGDARVKFAALNASSVGLTATGTTQALFVWFNVAGTSTDPSNPVTYNPAVFATSNAAIACPAGTGVTAPAPTATPKPPVTGDLSLPGGWGLYLAIIGAGVITVGIVIARRSMAKS